MSPEHTLWDLALVFGVLFAAAAVALALRQSLVPFYIVAGVALQPLIGDAGEIRVFATLGVAVLLFVVGLEFSVSSLRRNLGPLAAAGALDLAVNFGLGLACGLLLGMPPLTAAFFGAAFYISSSVIVARSIIDYRLGANVEAVPALGILVFEDLFIALFLAALAGAAAAGSPEPARIALGLGRAVAFAVGLLVLARIARRPLGRWLGAVGDELLVLFLFFWLLTVAAAAESLEISEAVGAFLAGLVIGETAEKVRVERILAPYQQLFAALFFVAFGLMIDTSELGGAWALGLGVAALGLAGKLASGWLIGWQRGFHPATRLRLGVLLVPRGEFSVIVAGAAVAAAVPGSERIVPLVAVLVLALGLLGPVLVSHGDPLIQRLVRR